MPSVLRQTYKDFSKEATKNHVFITTMTAGNFNAVIANVNTLTAAEDALTLGARQTEEVLASETFPNAAIPTDEDSQRERKWLITYQTSAGNKYKYTIPCAAVRITGIGAHSLLQTGSDMADLTAAEWVAWISAFIAVAIGKDGNGVSAVLSAELVGRNL